MIYFFVVMIGGLGTLAYLAIMFNAVPGAADERLGKLDPLPEKLGEWLTDDSTTEGASLATQGKRLEQRHLLEPGGLFKRQVIVKQVRVRDVATNEIVEVRPEVRSPRRRRHS
jgi:hypothetical protein